MKQFKKLTKLLHLLQIVVTLMLALMMINAMQTLFVLMKGESLF